MNYKILDDHVIITIFDTEHNSGDKACLLSLAISKHMDYFSIDVEHIDAVWAIDRATAIKIDKTIWDNLDFQKDIMFIELTL